MHHPLLLAPDAHRGQGLHPPHKQLQTKRLDHPLSTGQSISR